MDGPLDPVALAIGVTAPHSRCALLPKHPLLHPCIQGVVLGGPRAWPSPLHPLPGQRGGFSPGGGGQAGPATARPARPLHPRCPFSTGPTSRLSPRPGSSPQGPAPESGRPHWATVPTQDALLRHPELSRADPSVSGRGHPVDQRQGTDPTPRPQTQGPCRILTPAPGSPGRWSHAGHGSPDSPGRGGRNGKYGASRALPGWASPRTTRSLVAEKPPPRGPALASAPGPLPDERRLVRRPRCCPSLPWSSGRFSSIFPCTRSEPANFQMHKLDLEKAEEPEIKLPTFIE